MSDLGSIDLTLEQQSQGWTFKLNEAEPVGFFETAEAASEAAMDEISSLLAQSVAQDLSLN